MITKRALSLLVMSMVLAGPYHIASASTQNQASSTNAFAFKNGGGILYEKTNDTFEITFADGHRKEYKSEDGRGLLADILTLSNPDDVSQASEWVIKTSAQNSKAVDSVIVVDITDEQYFRLEELRLKNRGMSADELQKLIKTAVSEGKASYAEDRNRIQLSKPSEPGDGNAFSPEAISNIDFIMYAGKGKRKGSKEGMVGVQVDRYSVEVSWNDEGKQPPDQYGPINQINRLLNINVGYYVPVFKNAEAFVSAGLTSQHGFQDPRTRAYFSPTHGFNGWNVGYGMQMHTGIKNLWVRASCRYSYFQQQNIDLMEYSKLRQCTAGALLKFKVFKAN